MTDILKINNLSCHFGGIKALSHITLSIARHELACLIGPNGAGKTTLFNMITGIYRPTEGEIYFNGHSIHNLARHKRIQLGMARTFQNIRLLKGQSVLSNIKVALDQSYPHSFWESLWRTPRFKANENEKNDLIYDMLKKFNLEKLIYNNPENLSYGTQKKIEILRALALKPSFLLLDEPAAGLPTNEKAELIHFISDVKKQYQLTILLIEHDMNLVMKLAERIIVLDQGIKIAEGTPLEI